MSVASAGVIDICRAMQAMERAQEKKYTVVFKNKTTGEVLLAYTSRRGIVDIVRQHGLSDFEYAVIDGSPVKTFNERHISGS
ncbi:MAG: hypothetical protein MN733_27690 [Nitrososphaera sp.]|nr:hypothetical protein [Nitrososphaera sp.]